ncbi:hypothetical protein MPER_11578 [Moniliophthora perniciosa FA553]|nr:hypothetical protein MPER_11578 [Moniliophthora perniciosa FA553]
MALVDTHLPDLTLVSKGKVRNIYSTSSTDHLLFVATDRISAYDVILKNGIPDKGKLLTQISLFWFKKLGNIIPNHFVTADIDEMPEQVRKYKDQLKDRTMLVRKAKVIQIEAIVRGYLTGEIWLGPEYQKDRGQSMGSPLPTKHGRSKGAHDENFSPEQAVKLLGQVLYDKVSQASLELYSEAASYAHSRGLILADTKFEFGLIPSTSKPGEEELILVDEVLTPDSSRYWPLEGYEPGKTQPSFDKQYLRNWLVSAGFRKGLESGREGEEGQGWLIDEDIVQGTKRRYEEAVKMLMG